MNLVKWLTLTTMLLLLWTEKTIYGKPETTFTPHKADPVSKIPPKIDPHNALSKSYPRAIDQPDYITHTINIVAKSVDYQIKLPSKIKDLSLEPSGMNFEVKPGSVYVVRHLYQKRDQLPTFYLGNDGASLTIDSFACPGTSYIVFKDGKLIWDESWFLVPEGGEKFGPLIKKYTPPGLPKKKESPQ